MNEKTAHWNNVYGKRAANEVSWFQAEASASLALIGSCNLKPSSAVLDVGAGASTLVDGLLSRGFTDVTLLDISESAFEETRQRISPNVGVHYVVADITAWKPQRAFSLWHDRAVFHFLTDERDRAAYRSALADAVPTGHHAIIATFHADGPERCSGLPVRRYSAEALAAEFEGMLRPVEERREQHRTPSGSEQSFVYVRFERL
jgi:SAM-dependent methyltransferase